MKLRHNKKRNTAFLYEALIKEYTKAVIAKNTKEQKIVKNILKEFFSNGTLLKRDLEIYNTLIDAIGDCNVHYERLMFEVKKDFLSLDRKKIFNKQTSLLKRIHESLSHKFFSTFLSNYRSIATVGQFLNSESLPASQRIILENKMFETLSAPVQKAKNFKHIDNLTLKTFTKKFNETYKHSLRTEQKTLLTHYITSFSDNGVCLKAYMNEEIGRLKEQINLLTSHEQYSNKFFEILSKLDSYSKTPITNDMIKEIFYIQDLLHEVNKNAN